MPRRGRRCALGFGGGRTGARGGGGPDGPRPVQRNAANARERARMRVLSRAFCRLKTTLPWVPPDTKLSKLDTLRLATSYIAHLRHLTNAAASEAATEHLGASDDTVHPHPTALTWPYSFPRSVSNCLKPHFEPVAALHEEDEDDCEEEEDDDGDWSQCSSQDAADHHRQQQRPNTESFLAHFTDVLMDIS